ncbi:hypothetical protein [Trinickia sp.]|uniref:hypothetical protein n=1 Tax=Trinickia sp. TaxID=2571163 RepID=UPI003F8206E4
MNTLLSGNMRTPLATGVSAEINPFAVPPATVVAAAEHVIELAGGVCAWALLDPTLANA